MKMRQGYRFAFGLLAAGSVFAAALGGCSSSSNPVACVTAAGPALDAAHAYVIAASTLSEEWTAARRDAGGLTALPRRGLTGTAPNDLDVSGDRLFIVNSGDNTISAFDLTTGEAAGCIGTGTGTNPWELFVDPSDPDRGWVTTFLTGEILELDLAGMHVVRRRTVEAGLEGLFVTDTQVLVTLTGYQGSIGAFESGTVILLDKGTLEETERLRVPANSQFVFRGGDDRFHVVCSGDFGGTPGSIARIEADGSAVRDTLALEGSPGRAVLGPDGIAFVVGYFGGLQVYDTVTFTAGTPLSTDIGFYAAVVADTTLYAANFEQDAVTVFELTRGTVVQTLPMVGDGPVALALYP
jgi:DNA-binding beta-propeller fold protein YncE